MLKLMCHQDCFQLPADNPLLGRSYDSIQSGLRRFEIGKHVVFYILDPSVILIVRVLHQQMIPPRRTSSREKMPEPGLADRSGHMPSRSTQLPQATANMHRFCALSWTPARVRLEFERDGGAILGLHRI
jgi:hypothetical protein